MTEIKTEITKKVDDVSNRLARLEFDAKKDISTLNDGHKQTYGKLTVVTPLIVKLIIAIWRRFYYTIL